ncbi:hypothetical protein [Sandaracinus amylolyticus]|uniref:Uncharacterized protein n=1 Tax=Sandaracinus amylolyticus TaxID=927083 RepID=A0A0F6YJM6_9BACT|nr:hypothetical protein [Sandaracinus amylolyticus]AKF08235.1 hypothetical protein DB32_005384 [Sandaracinus amylolyticus]
MSDDPPSRPKHGTVPGFGPPSQPLPPLEVQPIAMRDDASPEVVAGAVRMVVEPTPHPEPQVRYSVPQGPEDARRRAKGPPAVDIDLVYERRSAPLPDQPWIFLEIWTRNTIYQLDASLICVDVIDQGTRRAIAEHPLRGARLVGGQSRDGDAMELSHPFPRPGSEAVFEQTSGRHVRFSQTSSVTRVVMRLRVLTVEPEQLLPTWEDVSGKWDLRTLGQKPQGQKK